MKFEKKVILGSIGGFITTALGIIAVFFPSVFNLEKKTMEEINIFIKSQADVDNLRKAIEKNQGKVVKLDVTYCYDPVKYDESNELNTVEYNEKLGRYDITESKYPYASYCLRTKEGCEFDENGWLIKGVVLQGGIDITEDYVYENEEGGSIIFVNKDKNANDYFYDYFYLSVPHETKGKYAWKVNDNSEGCLNDASAKETLTGAFYVNELKNRLRGDGREGVDLEIELDPLTKKELTLRDY